jgi:chemotaxis protein CheC
MMDQDNNLLHTKHLAALRRSFHRGSADASAALAKWIGKPSVIEIDSLEQLPLEEATGLLAVGDEPICFCSTEVHGLLTAEMILAFDDASGLALADMLLDQPQGTTQEWTAMATSAVLETTNILCCAYLNSLSRSFPRSGLSSELLPTPPRFARDFAESLLEFALIGQVTASDQLIVARTRFEIDAKPVNWTLLFVPDAMSMSQLPVLLSDGEATR